MKAVNRMSLSELVGAKAEIELAIFSRLNEVKVARQPEPKKQRALFRNPKNKNETWAGRGRRPFWLVAALKRGRKLADFAVH